MTMTTSSHRADATRKASEFCGLAHNARAFRAAREGSDLSCSADRFRAARVVRALAARRLSLAGRALPFALIPLFLAACGDDPTPPASTATPESHFEATLDPDGSSFVLSRVTTEQPGLDLELVGTNLVSDLAAGTVSLDVAMRNVSRQELAAPAEVWLSDFRPEGVAVRNPDFTDPDDGSDGGSPNDDGTAPVRFGFDYAAAFGEDQVLAPGETSTARSWTFAVPGQGSFSFAAVATFGSAARAVLAGGVFHDLDGDGVRDPDEPPFSGRIVVTRPDGSLARVEVLDGGRYRLPVREVGLHRVTYEPPALDCACDVVVTTPNPLEVIIVPDANGQPQDYLGATFGARVIRLGDEVQPILLTDRQPDEIPQDPYRLGEIALRGDVLVARVGFSGCSQDQPFALYMTGGFLESFPVQARLVLGHDALGEECDAAWERTLRFDLRPLREAYVRGYGEGPATIVLRLTDPQGIEHELRYSWGTPRD